jgi:tetratricopeptide (TPR) repeat protein/tRNA A-37 threonylcarbamoyl transferase component Bud32
VPCLPAEDLPRCIGRFEVRSRLGEGAFGIVYRARDPQLDREVALKVAKPHTLNTPLRVKRFLREARAAANLRHSNIVPVFDSGQDGDQYYIASAFIAGQTLAELIRKQPVGAPLESRRAALIVQRLADALGYAHKKGVVHRDVKPANVLLDEQDEPLLTDFGLALREEGAERLTQEGARLMGTPAYMAPEQARGEACAASDQYSLGCTLYEALTGRTPFGGSVEMQILEHQSHEPAPPRTLSKDAPLDLETICLKALAKSPAERYTDCQAMADDLRRWLEGQPIQARRLGIVERAMRWALKEPRLAGAGAAALGLLIALVVVLSTDARRLKEQNEAMQHARDEAQNAEKRADDELHRLARILDSINTEILDDPSLTRLRQLDPLIQKLEESSAAAVKHYQSDHTPRKDVADLLVLLGTRDRKLGDARSHFEEAKHIYDQLAERDPDDREIRYGRARVLLNLGQTLDTAGDLQLARERFHEALRLIGPLSSITDSSGKLTYKRLEAEVLHSLASLHQKEDRPEAARKRFLESVALRREVVKRKADARNRRDLARGYGYLGDVFVTLRRWEEAGKAYQESLDLRQKLAEEQPQNVEAKFQLTRGIANLAVLAKAENRRDTAIERFREVQRLQKEIRVFDPETKDYKDDLARASYTLGSLLTDSDERDEAGDNVKLAVHLYAELCHSDPENRRYQADRAASYAMLGKWEARYDPATAAATLGKAEGMLFPQPDRSGDDSYRLASVYGLQVELFGKGTPSADQQRRRRDAAEQAFAELDKAISRKSQEVYYLKSDTSFTSLRNDPSYKERLEMLEAKVLGQ